MSARNSPRIPTSAPGRPFTVLFAGRTEANKGIFDLVEICRSLEAERPGDFQFDICGEGSGLESLRASAAASGRGVPDTWTL